MEEPKHFKYEGNIVTKPKKAADEVVIKEVNFLTPARIVMTVGEETKTVMASVDIVNRKVYNESGDDGLSKLVFAYIDDKTILPEDFFAAPDEVSESAAAAKAESDQMREQYTGGLHE